MTWQLANAKVWDGSQWVAAVGASPVMAGLWTSVARNVTVTASTSANTKGAWVELIASNAAATDWVEIYVEGIGANGVNTATLLDIGVGAAGAETAVISDVALGGAVGIRFDLPLAIASGQRISARIQSVVTGGKTAIVFLQTFAAGISAPSSVTTIGTSTANSEGTTFSPANTWVQITASTPTDFQYLMFVPSLTTTAVSPSAGGFVDLASGASGSEVIVSRVTANWTTTESISVQFPLLAIGVPAGTRLAGRAPRADIDGTVIGIPYP